MAEGLLELGVTDEVLCPALTFPLPSPLSSLLAIFRFTPLFSVGSFPLFIAAFRGLPGFRHVRLSCNGVLRARLGHG